MDEARIILVTGGSLGVGIAAAVLRGLRHRGIEIIQIGDDEHAAYRPHVLDIVDHGPWMIPMDDQLLEIRQRQRLDYLHFIHPVWGAWWHARFCQDATRVVAFRVHEHVSREYVSSPLLKDTRWRMRH